LLLGLSLFYLQEPDKCLLRGDSWMFAPEAEYERQGDVQDVVFPCGYTVAADGDTINLYYGAADSSVALAHGSIRTLLRWLDTNRHSEHSGDRRHKSSPVRTGRRFSLHAFTIGFTQGARSVPDDLKKEREQTARVG